MRWNSKAVESLQKVVVNRYFEMRAENKTDRRNFSAIWNRYLKKYGAEVLHNFKNKGDQNSVTFTLGNLMDLINYRNEVVSDSVMIRNPDRMGQYILIPREMAAKIMVLGML